jgi:hypothetical protein
VHGFGFSFLLRDSLQFAGSHLATSLVTFNIGVELGQLVAILLMVPVLDALFRRAVPERIGVMLLSALVAHSAWHWTGARWAELRQYRFEWPALDLLLLAELLRWLMLALILGGAVWLLYNLYDRLLRRAPGIEPVEEVRYYLHLRIASNLAQVVVQRADGFLLPTFALSLNCLLQQ